MPNHAEEIVRDVLDAWNARDLPRMLSFMTDDVEWYDMGMPHPPARGRDAVQTDVFDSSRHSDFLQPQLQDAVLVRLLQCCRVY